MYIKADNELLFKAVEAACLADGYKWTEGRGANTYMSYCQNIRLEPDMTMRVDMYVREEAVTLERFIAMHEGTKIVLNDEYFGVVSADGSCVKVGCQSFDLDRIRVLYHTMRSMCPDVSNEKRHYIVGSHGDVVTDENGDVVNKNLTDREYEDIVCFNMYEFREWLKANTNISVPKVIDIIDIGVYHSDGSYTEPSMEHRQFKYLS